MTTKKELQFAYGLAIVLFVVGVVSYAAFPAKSPDEPIRIMFKATAGKVLFGHKVHVSDVGYALACNDCHHHPMDDPALRACGDCHTPPVEGEKTVNQTCLECHGEDDDEVQEEIPKRADAFHNQCVGCHEGFEAGPQPGPAGCAGCHVL